MSDIETEVDQNFEAFQRELLTLTAHRANAS